MQTPKGSQRTRGAEAQVCRGERVCCQAADDGRWPGMNGNVLAGRLSGLKPAEALPPYFTSRSWEPQRRLKLSCRGLGITY